MLLATKHAALITGFSPQEIHQHYRFNRIHQRYGHKSERLYNIWELIQLRLFIVANTKPNKNINWQAYLSPQSSIEREISLLAKRIAKDTARLTELTNTGQQK